MHAVLHEVRDTDWLVSLGCNMHHVDPQFVQSVYVCAVLHQKPDKLNVAVERCEMQRSEPFFT